MNFTTLIQDRRGRTALKVLLPGLVAVAIVYQVKFAPAPVTVHEVKPSLIAAEVLGTGTLEARVKTTISPRIQERLAEVLVDQNDPVQAGQLLARLEDGELRQQVEVLPPHWSPRAQPPSGCAWMKSAREPSRLRRVQTAELPARQKASPSQN